MTLTSPIARAGLFIAGSLALAAGLCLRIVPEDRQGVLLHMGEPTVVYNQFRTTGPSGAGLIAHWPLVEQVVLVERSLLGFSTLPQGLRSADQQLMDVSAQATVRIIDPAKLVRSAQDSTRAIDQLRAFLAAQMQAELGKRELIRLAMPGSGGAAQALRQSLDVRARSLGVQVIDVRLAGVGLPAGAMQETFSRMISLREDKAQQETARGQQEAQLIIAEGQAESARIVKEAAAQDPEFYTFWRAMRSYEDTFGADAKKGKTTIILGPDSDYMKQFKGK